MSRKSDLEVLLDHASTAEALEVADTSGLRSRISMRNYLRIADEIAAAATGPVLDWGAGYGQVGWLLQRSGLQVVCYDVGPAFADARLPLTQQLTRVIGDQPVELPFRSQSFGSAVSCGVLEHVPDPDGSLEELGRVLTSRGRLFVYNLPQKHSYKEFFIRRFELGYAHENTFTVTSTRRMLERHGYRVLRARRGGFLPHSMTGLPAGLKKMYNAAWRPAYVLDRGLSSVGGLNRFAEAVEIVAERIR